MAEDSPQQLAKPAQEGLKEAGEIAESSRVGGAGSDPAAPGTDEVQVQSEVEPESAESANLGFEGRAIEAEEDEESGLQASEAEFAGDPAVELEELQANEVAFSWQASEYVQHHKGAGWYLGFFGLLVVLAGVAVFLQYWLTVAAFAVMAGVVFVYAHKPPRTLMYELTPSGITIDGRALSYSEFRSFGVLPDEEWHQIDLDPVKRFSPRITILFEDEDFDDIVGHLELHLPRIDHKPDLIDRISRRLRF